MCHGTSATYCSCTQSTWARWVSINTSSTATTSTDTVWYRWANDSSYAPPVVAVAYRAVAQTDEQLAAAARRREEARARAEEEAERQAAAKARAETLLLEHLDEEQRGEWQRERAFRVISKDGERVYRIRDGWAGNVELLNAEGVALRRYCIHPSVDCPNEDNALAQKFLLETDEEAFIRIANATQLRAA